MKHPVQTLLAAAMTAALAAGPAWSQGGATSPGGAATAPGTTSSPGGSAGADTRGGTSSLTRADREFVKDAAMAGMAEVEASRLAVQKASSPAVKQFAQKMIDDHTAANAELAKFAQSKGLTPPAEVDRTHRRAMDSLQKRSGEEFDRDYMKLQVSDHQKTVSLFEKQARDGKDPQLKQWAQSKLPVLREHLQMARSETDERAQQRGSDMSVRGGPTPGAGSTAGSAATGTGSSATGPGAGSATGGAAGTAAGTTGTGAAGGGTGATGAGTGAAGSGTTGGAAGGGAAGGAAGGTAR